MSAVPAAQKTAPAKKLLSVRQARVLMLQAHIRKFAELMQLQLKLLGKD
jgi:hypothetical protein